MVAHPTGLLDQVTEGGHLHTQLLQFDGGGELIGQPVARCLVQVVLVQLFVGQPAPQPFQVSDPLLGRQGLQFFEKTSLLLQPPPQAFVDGTGRAG